MEREKVVLVIILAGLVCFGPIQMLMAAQPRSGNELGIHNDQENVLTEGVKTSLVSQFYENMGQLKNIEVLYYGTIPGGHIGFCADRILLWMRGTQRCVILNFLGTEGVTPIAREELSHNTNYFLGDGIELTGIRGFKEVVYNNIWPGISLIYKATDLGAKYEYHVGLGADPAHIRIRSENHDALIIEKNKLQIQIEDEAFVDEGLAVLQGDDSIDASFVMLERDIIGFNVVSYDSERPLIIDPLIYSTYVGAEDYDSGRALAVDSSGNAYVTGTTDSLNFPTENAYDYSYNGGSTDCFVFKLNSTGNGLLYSTFIGGEGWDSASSIKVDSSGSAYVTGTTDSQNFPTVNAFDDTYNEFLDCFVLKLNATGNGLLYSTFIGGNSSEYGVGIAIDTSGRAYVTGYTRSISFPTLNAYDTSHNGFDDCFVLKLNSDGDQLLYSTYVGGEDTDRAFFISIDANDSAYVTGMSTSTDFPMVSAYDDSFNGYDDCIVFKLNAAGDDLVYSTYVGGSVADIAGAIVVDQSYDAYVTGRTVSTNFPTVNAYDDTHNGNMDCFVFKLNSTGNGLIYSTFVGGSVAGDVTLQPWDEGRSIAIDTSGNAYVTGLTDSSDFPTVNAYDSTYNGLDDIFVFKLNPDGNALLYSTFVGGIANDAGNDIVLDSDGNIYVVGITHSSDFPILNAFDDTYNGYSDVIVFKLELPSFFLCWWCIIVVVVVVIIIIPPIGWWWWRRRKP